jgi:D-alanyl-D-alanine carboxypeptidase (penicillin-binding protein 5/6)
MKRPLLFLTAATLLVGCAASPPASQSRRATPAPPPVAAAPSPEPIWPADAPGLFAQSAVMIDARTGQVLFQKNADARRVPASTQKLLTGLIIARHTDLDGLITINPAATRVSPTKLGLRSGERYTRRALLEAFIVKSSNDAAAALAIDYAGSEEAFAAKMNETARELGAHSSYFVNSHGLPAEQYSTARDIARIAFAAYRNPTLRTMMNKEQSLFRHNNGRINRLESTNKLLGRSPAFNGMKTGYTNAAGRCLVSSGYLNGREVILVQLGSRTKYIFDDAARIMAWSGGYRTPLYANF